MTEESYKKYRPVSFKQVIGQPQAVKVLSEMVKNNSVPHAILLSGPSGCGKTTLARILRQKLECHDRDFVEINAAESRGIDTVREIQSVMRLAPMMGKTRVWLIDESGRLTLDGQAALLKMLEDTPSHVYFMLATTDPNKLLKTIHTRCTEIKVSLLPPKSLKEVVSRVLGEEKKELSEAVVSKLVEIAEGSARKVLVLLDSVIGLTDEKEQLDTLQKSEFKQQAIEIARAIMNTRNKWIDIAKLIKEVDEEPESIRRLILAYASSVLLGGGGLADRAYQVINAFENNFYDSGKAGLARACYEVSTKR